jgi:nicotinate-nucleotide adenylyltransferase
MSAKRRIGLYGGTFDPVHNGHLIVARELLRSFALDQVLFVPAFAAPHKRGQTVASALHRYAMLAIATRREDDLVVSTLELDAPNRPYTVETLTAVREAEGPDTRIFFIMGADSWAEIASWREFERVLGLTDHIVVTRPGANIETRQVGASIRERIMDVRGFDRRSILRQLDHEAGPNIFISDVAFEDISATAIRKFVRDGERYELKTMVPPEVLDFVDKYELY